jgi:uncharacterized protein
MPLPVPTPDRLFALARSSTRSALDNARAAAESIALAVSDRQALAPLPHEEVVEGGLAELSEQECLALLRSRTVGRLAYVAREGVPDIAPVNYVMDGRHVLIRSGPGPKLQAAERGEVVAFEVDDVDEDAHRGWSIVVSGRAQRLSEEEQGRVPTPTPWLQGPRRHVVRIRPHRIAGRRID